MKCKNCGKELTGKKEFCDDNKGKCYREYRKKQALGFTNAVEEVVEIKNEEYDNLQSTLSQLKEENNLLKQSNESLIEAFEEDVLAKTKGNVALSRRLNGKNNIMLKIESHYAQLVNSLPKNERDEIINKAKLMLDKKEDKYPKVQEYLLWSVQIPKVLIDMGLFLKDVVEEEVIVDSKLQSDTEYLDEEIVPTKTKEWIKGDEILDSIRMIYNLKANAKSEIASLTDKLHESERIESDYKHDRVLTVKTRRELLELVENETKISSKRQGLKMLICAYEAVDGISFSEDAMRIKNYGNSYKYKAKAGQVSFGDVKGAVDELSNFIDELHKSPIGKLSTKKAIKKGDLGDLKLKISEFPNAKSFRVVNNTLEVYN